jgi:hypothetical protein
MYSLREPDTVSGRINSSHDCNERNEKFVPVECVRIVPAGNHSLPAAAQPNHWRFGIATDFLAAAGLRSWYIIRRGAGWKQLPGVLLPGTVVLILLFTAIFATISIIEDRKEGFLRRCWSR